MPNWPNIGQVNKDFHAIKKLKRSKLLSPSEYPDMYPRNQVISPCPTSCGNNGYYDTWLNGENDWIYRHLHQVADTLENLATPVIMRPV